MNEVIVPGVIRDTQGHAVGNLTKGDFQILDDGKPQAITGFMLIRRAAATNSNSPNPGAPETPATPRGATSTQRFVVFLFDDLNLSIDELPRVQQAATQALDSLAADDTVAVLATSGSNSGLTRDRAKLKQAIMKLKVTPTYRHDEHECPRMTYYQGDRIVNWNDDQALQAAIVDFIACSQVQDPSIGPAAEGIVRGAAQRAVALGEQNYRSNLGFLRLVLSKMGPLPGQHVIILVSPGFLTPDAEAMTLKSEVLDIAARANVVINALDARGLYTTNLDASQPGDVPTTGSIEQQYRDFSMLADENVMAELTDGKGGTFFHNNNNLEAGLRALLVGPEYLYLLAYSTAKMKPNGAYRELKVKVNQPGVTIQARRGYFAPKPEKTTFPET